MGHTLTSTVFIVDDDVAVVDAIEGVCRLMRWPVERYSSAEGFLTSGFQSKSGCLVLDLQLPGISGLELQAKLARTARDVPVVLISGHANVESAVVGMRNGAVTLLQKPFNSSQIISAITESMQRIEGNQPSLQPDTTSTRSLLAKLTAGQRQTARLVVAGRTNKQIASELGMSVRGVEDRRKRLMNHFNVRSLAEFVGLLKPLLERLDLDLH
jgi:two-component system response regulator FixJ